MDAPRELGRLLLVLGVLLAGAGAMLLYADKLPFRLGHLPGDIAYQGRHGSFYFPLATCIVLSAAATLLFWALSFFRR